MTGKSDPSQRSRQAQDNSTHQNSQDIPLQHGELAVSIAMANLLSITTARMVLAETLSGMRSLATKSINWAAAHWHRTDRRL
jgi:hypothetical protein